MKKKRFTNLKSKIMIYTVIPVAVSFVLISVVVFIFLFTSFRETARAESFAKGQEYADIFGNKINNATNYLVMATSILEEQINEGVVDREEMQKIFFNIFDNYGLVDGTSIMFEYNMYDGKDDEYLNSEYGTALTGRICYYFYRDNGNTAYLPEAIEDDIEFELPHYTDARDSNRPIYTEPVVYEIDGRNIPMFTLTHPVNDKNGLFIGAVTVDLFLEDLYDLLQNEKIYETGYIVITNDKEQVIYSPIFEDIGKSRAEAGVDYVLPAEDEAVVYSSAASIVNGKVNRVTTVPVYIEQLRSSFYISVAAPAIEIYATGLRLLLFLAIFSTLIVMAIGLIIYYMIGKISNPIKEITESANKIANGYMDEMERFSTRADNVNAIEEVRTLIIAIKKMLSQLNEVQQFKMESLELKLKKEKAEAEVRAKSDFLAKMSHEIRTPMNAIMGMSELILRKELPQDIYENAIGIKSASSNLLSIINDILDFSKIESGKMEIIEVNYLFASLVNDIISIIRMRLLDKSILFAVNIDCAIPASLHGDEVRIRQILLNLLSNAVKYTKEGFISLTINGDIQDNTIALTIDITDSGIGITDEDINKLFGDFVQIDLTKNKGIEGTGLGLAIARNLCRAMGGDVKVRSEYGKGSTFTMTLPQTFNTYEPLASVENPAEKSVLLYDPREIYVSSISRSIENLGVHCKSVKNVSALYDDLERYPYVFVPSFLYDSIKPVLKKINKQPKLVLLADTTIGFAPKETTVLTMPAHALSIANILNNIYSSFIEAYEAGISFIAPDARILIVDDIDANLKVGEGLMSPYEMQIDVCSSGKEAVEMITANRYDLVFMDHMMPEMDGLEATTHIRAMDGDYYKSLPIVALTANAVSGVREMFIQHGMDDFLAKPIETAKLDAILKKWVPKEKRKKAREASPADNKQIEETNSFISNLRTIPELSVDKALAVVGGSTEAFERIFKLTVRLLPENIRKLNNLIETDLPLYSIEVHGIKGVLNNIGAYSLGEMAFELENLSKAGDLDACKARHPALNSELSKFVQTVIPLVNDGTVDSKPSGDFEQLLQILSQVDDAVSFFDSVLALELLSPISEYTYGQELDEVILGLTNAFEQFDFDKASELINYLKGAINADE